MVVFASTVNALDVSKNLAKPYKNNVFNVKIEDVLNANRIIRYVQAVSTDMC